jgi:hypothetical protein
MPTGPRHADFARDKSLIGSSTLANQAVTLCSPKSLQASETAEFNTVDDGGSAKTQPRQLSLREQEGVNFNLGRVLPVIGAKMRQSMIVEIHPNHNPEESADG